MTTELEQKTTERLNLIRTRLEKDGDWRFEFPDKKIRFYRSGPFTVCYLGTVIVKLRGEDTSKTFTEVIGVSKKLPGDTEDPLVGRGQAFKNGLFTLLEENTRVISRLAWRE